jgi:hypothetical protein
MPDPNTDIPGDGLLALLLGLPGVSAYWQPGRLFDPPAPIELHPTAPSADYYRIVPTLLDALQSFAAGEPPIFWPHDRLPSFWDLAHASEAQWAAPGGTPLFAGTPSTGFRPAIAHPAWGATPETLGLLRQLAEGEPAQPSLTGAGPVGAETLR